MPSTVPPQGDEGSTSLVPIVLNGGSRASDLRDPLASEGRCPRVSFDLIDVVSGEVVPGACRTYGCEFCRARRMREWPYVLAQGLPERLVTLTLAPEDRERRRGQVKELAYRLRKDGYVVQWAWNTERNPKGTGYHVHLLQRGDYIPQRRLEDAWGGRRVDIRRIDVREGAAAYVLKDGLDRAGYIVKESVLLDGRPVHLSRGFLGGRTVRQTRAAVRRERFAGERRRWVAVARKDGVMSSCSASLLYGTPLPLALAM